MGASSLDKAVEHIRRLIVSLTKTRELSPAAKERATELLERISRAGAYLSALPVRKPFKKKCRCGMEITLAVTEQDKWIPLHEGKGGFELINGVAVSVEGFVGKWVFHGRSCTKGKQETF